jgi:predicted ArsR family transcriptional regulator
MSFDEPPVGRRNVTDPRGLRALAHPTRLALLELLAYYGPLTATEAGEHLGESAASCSFHFRQLASHGFVEEAGGGSGRSRPWRAVRGVEYSASESDPETIVAGTALTQVVEARGQQLVETWHATAGSYPAEWQQAAFEAYHPTFMTAAELRTLGEAIEALFEPSRERGMGSAPRPTDGLPVAFIARGFPVAPPKKDAAKKDAAKKDAAKKDAAKKAPR